MLILFRGFRGFHTLDECCVFETFKRHILGWIRDLYGAYTSWKSVHPYSRRRRQENGKGRKDIGPTQSHK